MGGECQISDFESTEISSDNIYYYLNANGFRGSFLEKIIVFLKAEGRGDLAKKLEKKIFKHGNRK